MDPKQDLSQQPLVANENVSTKLADFQQQCKELQVYREAFETAPISMAFLDEQSRIFHCNEQVCALTGYTREELLGKNVIDFLADEDRPDHIMTREKILSGGRAGSSITSLRRYRRKDGVYIQIRVHASYLGREKEHAGLFIIVEDITKQLTTESELRAIERQFSSLLSNMYEGVAFQKLVFDEQKQPINYLFTAVNQRFEEILGMPASAVVNKLATEVYEVSQPPFLQDYVEVVKEEKPHRREVVFSHKDKYFLISFAPLSSTEVGTIFFDITEQKRKEKERLQLLENLKVARDQALQANQIKDSFLATLSHELRTPLTTILTWSQMARQGKLAPDRLEHALATIEQSAKTQAKMIGDLLDISRILSGKLSVDKRMVNLISICQSAVASVAPLMTKNKINLETSYFSSFCPVVGDPVRLEQVLLNLLNNAIKFTPQGGKVSLRVLEPVEASAEDKKQMVRMEIQDTGAGIAPDVLPHIFERFWQQDPTLTRKHGGLGLGLSISRNLLELMGGTISAASPGLIQGATFTLELPYKEVSTAAPDFMPVVGAAKPLQVWGMDDFQLSNLRVLFVDDEPSIRESFSVMLKVFGMRVQVAESCAEALKIFAKFKPEIVIADLAMPEEDGYDLIKKIRALSPEDGGRVPAIALTAYAGPEDVLKTLASGFQAHVTKPTEARHLFDTISKLLKVNEIDEPLKQAAKRSQKTAKNLASDN